MTALTQEKWDAMNAVERLDYLHAGPVDVTKRTYLDGSKRPGDPDCIKAFFVCFVGALELTDQHETLSGCLRQAAETVAFMESEAKVGTKD